MRQRRGRLIRNKGVIAAAHAQRAPNRGARLLFQTDPFTRRYLRPVLIALLSTSLAVALLVLGDILTPGQPWLRLVWLCLFAALEGAYTTAWLNNPDSRGVERGTYRAAEALLLIVVARVVSWLIFGGGIPTPDDVRVYLGAPLSFFMTGNFFTTALVTLLTWWLAVTVGRIFTRLDVGVDEVSFYTLSLSEQKAQTDNRPIQIARGELQNQFLRLWLGVGLVMDLLAALSTYQVREVVEVANPFAITRLGMRPVVLFALLLYFLAGLWLLSHARLLRLNARWLMDGITKEASLERAWQRASLVLILAIAFLASFLPIGSTLAISRILGVVVAGGAYLLGLVYAFIGYLFAAALALLTRNAGDAAPPQLLPTPAPLPTPPPVAPPPANPVAGFVFSSLFWTLLIALVIGALLFFLRERGYKLERAGIERSLRSLSETVRAVWLRLRGRARSASRSLRQRLQPRSGLPDVSLPPVPRPRFLRLNALSPREQVRYYYLSTVRRAGERGVRREPQATPLEYARDLKATWPDAESDVDELTDAFLTARYSPAPLDRSAAGRVRAGWERIKRRLRGR